MVRLKRLIVLALLGLSLTACGDDRECLRSHTDTIFQPQYVSDAKGNMRLIGVFPIQVNVCDEYVPEGPQ